MMSARNTVGSPAARRNATMGTKKKHRKTYTISRPREKWAADEHDRFLHGLLVFGRDWKTIEQFVGTKTATQIRSHAQKYFLKAHRLGLAAALPPPHPRRAAVIAAAGASAAADWAALCASSLAGARLPAHDERFVAGASSSSPYAEEPAGAAPSEEAALFVDALLHQEDTVRRLPLSPDDVRFAEVYRFVGDVFGSGGPVEAHLQRLHAMDPVVAETILLVLMNLEDNLCA